MGPHQRCDFRRSGAGPGSIFKDEQRVFRFQEGQRGADAYLAMMDKYGPGQGHYFPMMQLHAEKMARELAMLHVFGPGFRSSSEQLLKQVLQGRALGIYGDFLKESFSRSGTGLTEAAIGPLAQPLVSLNRLSSEARRKAEGGEHFNFGAALANDIQTYAPGSTVSYARA